MSNKLFSPAIYQHVIDHFKTIGIDQVDTFPAIREYHSVHAWMLLSFDEYHENWNSPPVDTTYRIKLAVAKAKELVTEDDNPNEEITQPQENLKNHNKHPT